MGSINFGFEDMKFEDMGWIILDEDRDPLMNSCVETTGSVKHAEPVN